MLLKQLGGCCCCIPAVARTALHVVRYKRRLTSGCPAERELVWLWGISALANALALPGVEVAACVGTGKHCPWVCAIAEQPVSVCRLRALPSHSPFAVVAPGEVV